MKYELDASKLKVGDKVWYRNHGINREGTVIEIKKHNLVDDRTNFEKKYRHIILDDNEGERYEGHLQVLINAANGIETVAEHEPKKMDKALMAKRKDLFRRINLAKQNLKRNKDKLETCRPANRGDYLKAIENAEIEIEDCERQIKWLGGRMGGKRF